MDGESYEHAKNLLNGNKNHATAINLSKYTMLKIYQ